MKPRHSDDRCAVLVLNIDSGFSFHLTKFHVSNLSIGLHQTSPSDTHVAVAAFAKDFRLKGVVRSLEINKGAI